MAKSETEFEHVPGYRELKRFLKIVPCFDCGGPLQIRSILFTESFTEEGDTYCLGCGCNHYFRPRTIDCAWTIDCAHDGRLTVLPYIEAGGREFYA